MINQMSQYYWLVTQTIALVSLIIKLKYPNSYYSLMRLHIINHPAYLPYLVAHNHIFNLTYLPFLRQTC